MKVYLILLVLLLPRLAFAKPVAEFLGKSGMKCVIIRTDSRVEQCNKNKRFTLEVGDIVKASDKLAFRLLSDEIQIKNYKENDTFVYAVYFKEKPDFMDSVKSFFGFFSDYKKRENVAATRGIGNSDFLYPKHSFVTFDEIIEIRVDGDSIVEEPVILKFYTEKGVKLPDSLKLRKEENVYYVSFSPEEMGLQRFKGYMWRVEDSYGVNLGEGFIFITNLSSQELESMVNKLVSSVKHKVNNDLKKALIYAKLGYLWRAGQILSRYEEEQLDKAYLKEIERYFKAEKE